MAATSAIQSLSNINSNRVQTKCYNVAEEKRKVQIWEVTLMKDTKTKKERNPQNAKERGGI